jgi:hypothetical protein
MFQLNSQQEAQIKILLESYEDTTLSIFGEDYNQYSSMELIEEHPELQQMIKVLNHHDPNVLSAPRTFRKLINFFLEVFAAFWITTVILEEKPDFGLAQAIWNQDPGNDILFVYQVPLTSAKEAEKIHNQYVNEAHTVYASKRFEIFDEKWHFRYYKLIVAETGTNFA